MCVISDMVSPLIQTLTKENKKLSVVIPMYNEEEAIESVINKIPVHPLVEIVIVDDGSKDNSVNIVKKYSHVKLILHEHNKGYGKTLLTGVQNSTGQIVVTMDSDGQHEPADLNNLVSTLIREKADVVVGSRYLGMYAYDIALTTFLGEFFVHFILLTFFRINVKNNQSGYRAFTDASAKYIFSRTRFHGFALTTEILMMSSVMRLKVREAKIHLYGRVAGTSRIKLFQLLKTIIHCSLYYGIYKYLGKKNAEKFQKFISRHSFISGIKDTKHKK